MKPISRGSMLVYCRHVWRQFSSTATANRTVHCTFLYTCILQCMCMLQEGSHPLLQLPSSVHLSAVHSLTLTVSPSFDCRRDTAGSAWPPCERGSEDPEPGDQSAAAGRAGQGPSPCQGPHSGWHRPSHQGQCHCCSGVQQPCTMLCKCSLLRLSVVPAACFLSMFFGLLASE